MPDSTVSTGLISGALPYGLAHLLGGTALVLSFGLLCQRRIGALIATYACQGAVLAAAAAWQGHVQGSGLLYLTAAITALASAVLIPRALRRTARRLDPAGAQDGALGVFAAMALGVGLVALSILVVLPTARATQTVAREDVAIALSVVLLGLLTMIARRTALTQVIGFLAVANGVALAGIGVPGTTPAGLPVAVVALVALPVLGVFMVRIRERVDGIDARTPGRAGGEQR